MKLSETEWNGMERDGMKRNGMERDIMKRNGTERNETEWDGMEWKENNAAVFVGPSPKPTRGIGYNIGGPRTGGSVGDAWWCTLYVSARYSSQGTTGGDGARGNGTVVLLYQ